MSKSSEYVKKWRKKVKEIIITCMGGECQICKYNKCTTALELHHVNPDEKDFTFGYLMASCRNWKIIYEEIAKCILLCSNCHREIHAGVSAIPEYFTKFDPIVADSLRTTASLMTAGSRPQTSKATKLNNQRRDTINGKIRLRKIMDKSIDKELLIE
jgi:hypothetical protein